MAVYESPAEGGNFTGTPDTDTFIGSEEADYFDGGAGDDYFYGYGGDDLIDGGIGSDRIYGAAGVDVIHGGDGMDTIYGGDDNDLIYGEGGYDFIFGDGGDDIIYGGAGADSIFGGEGNDTIYGGDPGPYGGDDIDGDAGNDHLIGSIENDLLDGGTGADILEGRDGNDSYWVDDIDDVIIEKANEGRDSVTSTISWTLGANLESLHLSNLGSDINGTGNALDNIIYGNNGDNVLDGGAGIDQLSGGDGNDTYIVDRSEEMSKIIENQNGGIDLVMSSVSWVLTSGWFGNIENLTLTGTGNINGTGNELDNIITGNSGSNELAGLTGNDTLIGGAGNDTYYYSKADGTDVIKDSSGTDTLYFIQGVTDQDITLEQSFTDLRLHIKGTADYIVLSEWYQGNTQIENIRFANNVTWDVDDLIHKAPLYIETVTEGDDFLPGTAQDDILNGLGGNDIMRGGLGNDILNGGSGADTMSGGQGNDTYIVDNAGDTVSENANKGVDTVESSIAWTLGSNVENLTLTGTANISGTGNDLDNILTGNSGINILTGGKGNDTYVIGAGDTVAENAGEGNDTVILDAGLNLNLGDFTNIENIILTGSGKADLTGDAKNNILGGNSGDNVLDGGLGADVMKGGAGNDTYIVEDVNDVAREVRNGGYDKVESSVSIKLGEHIEAVTLTGTADIDATGNTLDNWIIANNGDNVIDGGKGIDMVSYQTATQGVTVNLNLKNAQDTGAGHDTLVNVEYLTGSAYNDNLTGNWMDNYLNGANGNDVLDGGSGNDILMSGSGNDTLKGGDGNDTLNGGDDDDVLIGGAGNDALYGAAGQDVFVFNSTLGSGNVDKVIQFNGAEDTIRLDDAIFAKLVGGVTADNFAVNTAGKAMDANDYLVYDSAAGNLYYDADGNGAGVAVLFATLDNMAALTVDDFQIV